MSKNKKCISKLWKVVIFFLVLAGGARVAYKVTGGGECLPMPIGGCYLNDNLWLPVSAFSFVIAAAGMVILLSIGIVKTLRRKGS